MLMVRASEPRKLVLGDRTGTLEAAPRADVAPGLCVRVSGRVEGRGRLAVEALRVAEPDEYALDDLLDGPRIPVERMEADLRELIATIQCGHLRGLLDARVRAGDRDLGAVPRGARGQALPPGLPPRAARALADGRAERERDLGDVRRRGPRRRGHRRAAARHRQARRLHGGPAGDRPDRPRQAAGRDPARLLPRAPPDRGPARLPGRARGRGPAHHPQPPRPARARLAGRPLHARGDPRAHDRQPRRAPRVLRPPREGAPGRLELVRLGPRARRRRVVRRSRAA